VSENGRTPPNDELAERALIGHSFALGRIPEGVNGLAPAGFYRPANEVVWAAVQSLAVQQKPCDAISVRDHLQKLGKLDQRGGVTSAEFAELVLAPDIPDPGYTAGIIQEHSRRRRLIDALHGHLQRAHDGADIDEQVQRIVVDVGRMPGLKEQRSSWQPVDIEPVLDGTWQSSQPTVGRRTDGKGILYPGKTHTGIGETEAGKGWFAPSLAVDEMADGNHVVYVDFEDDEGGVVGRLLTMGISPRTIEDHFRYIHPEHPLTGRHLEEFLAVLHDTKPTLATLDGVTEAMTLHGLNPLDNVDIARFDSTVVKHFTTTGAAELSLDHVTKDRDGRGKYALGGVHKLNIVSGAGYILDNRNPFGIGIKGVSTVRIAKDRPGQLRANAATGSNNLHWYGDLVVDSSGDDLAEVCIYPPIQQGEEFRPTIYMARIMEELTKRGELKSQNLVETAVRGKATVIREALRWLILDGYVTDKPPYKILKPWVQP